MDDLAKALGAEAAAMGAASADCLTVPQALESLRLDVEQVFNKHRELCGGKCGPRSAQAPRCAAQALDVDVQALDVDVPRSPRLTLQAPDADASPRSRARPSVIGAPRGSEGFGLPRGVAQPQLPGLRPSVTPVHRLSGQRNSNAGPRRRRDFSSRMRGHTFDVKEAEGNWMHSLLQRSNTGTTSFVSRRAVKAVSKAASTISQHAPTARVHDFVSRPLYELAQVMLFFLDAVLVVWEMQHAAYRAASGPNHGAGGIEDALLLTVLMNISCACVVVDQLLKLAGGKFDEALGVGWQSFHVLVAVTQLIQTIGQHSHMHQRSWSQFRVGLAMLSTLRLGRVLSLVLVSRVIRQHRFFRELRIMVHALAGVLKVLLWSSLLIFTIILMFGTVLSEGTLALLLRSQPDGVPPSLQLRFGSLFDAVLTLFQSMSGGVDWEQVWLDLGALGWSYRGVYLLFICFSLSVLLNVVTAVFIESTMARSMNDRGLVVQNEVLEKQDFLRSMRKIFQELDTDFDGTITMEEMQNKMMDPEIGAYFTQLGVNPDQVGKLFFLLDRDKSGTLDQDEFLFGCLKFQGDAKSLDIAVIHQQVLWIHDTLKIVVSHLGIDADDMDSRISENVRNSCFSIAETEVPPAPLPCWNPVLIH
ncbi:unnamed protein product [Prorocentrum cordatum]|uniref:EF-hand domain-containing protein n=1 Tax=Prorocentrum cordatum TaxID=2364126 RepID=A0ABN9VHU9_9DINO|nr:unnamed protein product [Polarella glacialis]